MPRHSRSRSRSPHRHGHHHHHHHHRHHRPHKRSRHDDKTTTTTTSTSATALAPPNRALPFSAGPLSKHDLDKYRPLFGLYLDIQKQIYIEDLDEREVKGRWKSFVGRWNNGELAEGWYDPTALERAVAARQEEEEGEEDYEREQVPGSSASTTAAGGGHSLEARKDEGDDNDDDDDDDEEFGPELPTNNTLSHSLTHHSSGGATGAGNQRQGATEPSVDEVKARREDAADQARQAHEEKRKTLRAERREEKKLVKERLEDLAPRAEPGTRERQLEKKREANMSNRAFAQSAHEAGDVDVKESDVMGDEDSLGELKRLKQQEERKKNERELRREEILRARRAEREARVGLLREKEEKTLEYLRSLAKERFG